MIVVSDEFDVGIPDSVRAMQAVEKQLVIARIDTSVAALYGDTDLGGIDPPGLSMAR
jgi:hypothetical protein